MIRYDLGLAWNWEFDLDFLSLLRRALRKRGLFLLEFYPGVLETARNSLERRDADIRVFLDRASEADSRFLPLVDWVVARGLLEINPHDKAVRAMNKASMHLEFITAGIHTPHTIILAPWSEQADLGDIDLAPLGAEFFIKPAHGGGGEGVIDEACSLDQVVRARQEFPNDYYLLQSRVRPVRLGARPGWFRVIYCGGLIFPCWWDPETHVYAPVTDDEVELYGLAALSSTAVTIARVCGLDIFSTEMALTAEGVPVAVDYVNTPIDLRLSSGTPDGVPDFIVAAIAGRIADIVAAHLRGRASAR